MFGLFGNNDSNGGPTTTTTSGPPSWLNRYFRQLYGDAFDLQSNNNYPRPYQGQTYAGANPALQQAWQQTAQIAGGPNPFANLSSYANNMIQNNGMTSAMTSAMQPLQQIASGQQGINIGSNIRNIASGRSNININPHIARMAAGRMIGTSNPYLMRNLGTAATEAADQVGAQFAGSGRYGSGANQNVIAQNTGRIFSEGLGAQMNQDIANSLSANQQATGIRGQNLANQMSASGQIAGIEGTNIANRAGAANSIQGHLAGGAQRAAQWGALAPALNDMRYDAADRLARSGAQQQAVQQGAFSDAQRRWNESQGRNVNALSWLQSMLSGNPYTVQTQQQSQGSPIAGLLGGALTGGQIGNMFGMPAVGAGIGGLAGLFM